jgi:DNA-binding HxlR family transcriptional regulator
MEFISKSVQDGNIWYLRKVVPGGFQFMPDQPRMFIATIGKYQHDRIEYALLGRSVQRIELMHSDAPESKDAALKILEKYKSVVHLHEVNPWEYLEILSLALRLVNENPKYTPEFHIGLGTRVMTMALAMAALFTESEMFFVVEDEEMKPRELMEISVLPTSPIAAQKRTLLKILSDMKGKEAISAEVLRKKIKEIHAERTHEFPPGYVIPSSASLSKHLKTLESWGFIRRTKIGKKTHIQLTKLGETVLEMKLSRRNLWSDR